MTRFGAQRLPAYAAIAASGLIAGLALGRVEPIALAAPFLLALVVPAMARRPEISVRLLLDRDRALEGDEVIATIELEQTEGSERLEFLLRLPPDLVAPENAARAVLLRPGQERRVDVRLRCDRWGAFAVGPLLVRGRDTLGLRSWEGTAGERQMLRVYPREETLRELIPALETQVFAGNQVSRARGEGIEFADLREWQAGDRIRRVNWRATALRGSLWVNEQHPERNTDVVIFLDAFAEASGQGRRTNDRAVRAAATLAHGYLQRKDRVGLVAFGGFVSWLRPQAGVRQLYEIVDRLLTSDVTHSYVRHSVDVLPPGTLPAKALVIALTPLVDNRTAGALIDLRGRGYDLIVVEVVPDLLPERKAGTEEPLPERLWKLSREALRWHYREMGVPLVTWEEDTPLAVPLEEVMAFRHLARPA